MSAGTKWQHTDPTVGHPVRDTMTEFYSGRSLCGSCRRPVELTPAAARRIDREIAAQTARWHQQLVRMGIPVGAGTAYGACSSQCAHEPAS